MNGSSQQITYIAYFIPKRAASYLYLGTLGNPTRFTKDSPGRITFRADIDILRSRNDVVECNEVGQPLIANGQVNRPVSYTKNDSAVSSEKQVLVGDRAIVENEDIPDSIKIYANNEEEEEEEVEKEKKAKKKNKKKKKEDKKKEEKSKKSKKSKKDKKNKKKKKEDKKKDFKEDWDEDEDDD